MLRSFTSAVLVDFTSFRNPGARRSGVTFDFRSSACAIYRLFA